MAKLYAIYGRPSDPAGFDRYYFDTHVPLAKQVPGLRGYEITRGPIMSPAGPHAAYLVATLSFDSMADLAAALASAQGQAAAADLANFATGGVDLLMAETETI